jgi:aspartyl protease
MSCLAAHPAIRRSVLVVALAHCACTARDGPPALVPLEYEQELIKADFPNPMVRLTFNQRTAWFVVDTGAGVHTFAQWFADAAGMQIQESLNVRALDSTGQAVAVRGVREQAGRLGDQQVPIKIAIVAPFPPEFQASGIAGLVNPQLLAGEGEAAALDLRVPELRFESFDRARRRLGARIVPDDQVRIC